MPPRATLLADAGAGAGMGHLSRSTALAAALAARDWEVTTRAHGIDAEVVLDGVVWTPLADGETVPSGWTVLDSYRPLPVALGEDARVVWFQDEAVDPPERAEVVISTVFADGPAPLWLHGERYACLRPGYWRLPERGAPEAVRRVLVSTGSGDPLGAGGATAALVAHAAPDATVALVVGPYADPDAAPPGVETISGKASLLSELMRADLAVTAAGQTLLEALATGAPTVALPLAANQRPTAERLRAAGAVRLVEPGDGAALTEVVATLVGNAAARFALGRAGREQVDGYGAPRVALELSRRAQASP